MHTNVSLNTTLNTVWIPSIPENACKFLMGLISYNNGDPLQDTTRSLSLISTSFTAPDNPPPLVVPACPYPDVDGD
jgi:hypothetical protein